MIEKLIPSTKQGKLAAIFALDSFVMVLLIVVIGNRMGYPENLPSFGMNIVMTVILVLSMVSALISMALGFNSISKLSERGFLVFVALLYSIPAVVLLSFELISMIPGMG